MLGLIEHPVAVRRSIEARRSQRSPDGDYDIVSPVRERTPQKVTRAAPKAAACLYRLLEDDSPI